MQQEHSANKHKTTPKADALKGLAPSDRQTGFQVFLSLLLRTTQHPLLLLTGFWLFCLLVAGIAITNIVQIDASDQQSPTTAMSSRAKNSSQTKMALQAEEFGVSQPDHSIRSPIQPERTSSLRTHSDEEESLPFISLIAIALSCAAGSFLISRGCRPRQPIKRMQSSNSRVLSQRSTISQN